MLAVLGHEYGATKKGGSITFDATAFFVLLSIYKVFQRRLRYAPNAVKASS